MIGKTSRQISVSFPYASCDLCHSTAYAVELERLPDIEATAPEHQVKHGTMGYPEFELQGYDNSFRIRLNTLGWTHEVFHGKDLILCPECSKL